MTSEETKPHVSACCCNGARCLPASVEARLRTLVDLSFAHRINGSTITKMDIGFRAAMRKVKAILDDA